MLKLTIILFLSILSSSLWSQSHKYAIKKIDSLYKTGNYVLALKLNAEYLTQEESDNACGNVSLALYKAAEISDMLKNRNEAYSFLHRALKRARECKNDSVTWLAIRHLGGFFQGYEGRDSALYYLNLAHALIKEKDLPAEISSTTGMIGEVWNHQYNKPEQAMAFYKISLAQAEKSGNYKSMGYAYLRYGSFLAHHGNCEEGTPLVEKSVQLFLHNRDVEGLYWTRYSLSRVYKVCNRLLEAYELLDLHRYTQDSVFNSEAARQKVQYQLLYETSKKEKENLALTKEIELAKVERKNLMWLFTLGLVMVSFIFILIYRQNLIRKKVELQKQLESERARIFRELHDNIGSQLSQLSSSLDWVINPVRPIEEEEKQQILQNSHLTSKRIIQELRESIWALKKDEIPFVAFCDKLKSSIQHLHTSQQTLQIRFEENIDASMVGPEEALNLLRICQEATHNAMRHSKGSNLIITLKCVAGHYEIILEDDGIGFNLQKQVAQCFGLENMKHRAAEIGATLHIETAINIGTKVSLSK